MNSIFYCTWVNQCQSRQWCVFNSYSYKIGGNGPYSRDSLLISLPLPLFFLDLDLGLARLDRLGSVDSLSQPLSSAQQLGTVRYCTDETAASHSFVRGGIRLVSRYLAVLASHIVSPHLRKIDIFNLATTARVQLGLVQPGSISTVVLKGPLTSKKYSVFLQ